MAKTVFKYYLLDFDYWVYLEEAAVRLPMILRAVGAVAMRTDFVS